MSLNQSEKKQRKPSGGFVLNILPIFRDAYEHEGPLSFTDTRWSRFSLFDFKNCLKLDCPCVAPNMS